MIENRFHIIVTWCDKRVHGWICPETIEKDETPAYQSARTQPGLLLYAVHNALYGKEDGKYNAYCDFHDDAWSVELEKCKEEG